MGLRGIEFSWNWGVNDWVGNKGGMARSLGSVIARSLWSVIAKSLRSVIARSLWSVIARYEAIHGMPRRCAPGSDSDVVLALVTA